MNGGVDIQFSYSRVDCYKTCPRQYKYRYIDKIKLFQDPDPYNPLICGNAMHHGIETNEDAAIDWYYKQFYSISDLHVNEEIKLRYSIQQMRGEIDYNISQFEFQLLTDTFVGYIDLIERNDYGSVNLGDFKYANPKNIDRYKESGQLHVYKDQFERTQHKSVDNMAYIIMPKTMIRQKKSESIQQFRTRLQKELVKVHPIIVPVKYNPDKVSEYNQTCGKIMMEKQFSKIESKLCDWCDYKEYCQSNGKVDYMVLPENKRVPVDTTQPPVIWIYGAPFSGKTTFANQAPDVIHLNTDGNVKYVDGARIIIRDEVTQEGRIRKTKFAWENFVEAVDLIITGGHDFKTVVVDLLEDVLQFARLYMYNKLEIVHEQDAGYGKGYDMVRTQFLPQIRRLTAAGIGVILISHENLSEIVKKNGEKVSNVNPNIQSGYANKIAGMVDIVGRVIIDDNDNRWITFKIDNSQFGGGRLIFDENKVPLDYEKFMSMYKTAKPSVSGKREANTTTPKTNKRPSTAPQGASTEAVSTPTEGRIRRTRKSRSEQ